MSAALALSPWKASRFAPGVRRNRCAVMSKSSNVPASDGERAPVAAEFHVRPADGCWSTVMLRYVPSQPSVVSPPVPVASITRSSESLICTSGTLTSTV